MLYEFREHSSASDANNIWDAMGPLIVSYNTAKVWFVKFKNGESALNDKPNLVGQLKWMKSASWSSLKRVHVVIPAPARSLALPRKDMQIWFMGTS